MNTKLTILEELKYSLGSDYHTCVWLNPHCTKYFFFKCPLPSPLCTAGIYCDEKLLTSPMSDFKWYIMINLNSLPLTHFPYEHQPPHTNSNSEFTPDQSWINPHLTDPNYPIKHALGVPKRSYQLLLSSLLLRLLMLFKSCQQKKLCQPIMHHINIFYPKTWLQNDSAKKVDKHVF